MFNLTGEINLQCKKAFGTFLFQNVLLKEASYLFGVFLFIQKSPNNNYSHSGQSR